MSKPPLISIGVPAYNAEAHLGLTLEGLLGQTFSDFEIIISDNASTDGTRDVAESYRAKDSRIRYERQATNVGANPNYAHVVHVARGEIFKWSSASDWCAPTFLERCLQVLRAHDDTVLVVPRTRLFQNVPEASQDYPWDIELPDERPSARLVRLTTTLALNNAMNGLIRTAALRRTRVMEPYLGADYVLMGHLALLGKFRLIEDRLFYRRMESGTATALADRAAVWRHHYPMLSGRTLFQGIKRHLGWARIAVSTSIPVMERLRSLEHVARRCFWDREAILKDLRGAWHYYTRGTWPD
jgi:glycosyltransferase involved in cell wall biosynthesis